MNEVLQHWNKKYAGQELVFGTTPNEFLCTQVHRLKKSAKVLAVGDGEGRNGLWLAEQGFHVLSVDGAHNGVRKATEQAKVRNLQGQFQTECADLLVWDWPIREFDALACLHLYFMPHERVTMHHKMANTLCGGGYLILECFHPDNVGRGCGGPQIEELCYRAEDLAADFATMNIHLLEETERTVAPSTFHNGGQAKVTRLVAQKPE